jgi:hypothetical protein
MNSPVTTLRNLTETELEDMMMDCSLSLCETNAIRAVHAQMSVSEAAKKHLFNHTSFVNTAIKNFLKNN